MKSVINSHTVLLGITLFLSVFLSFWALEKDKCLEIEVFGGFKIKVGCQVEL